ncbi:MAG: hypothetical protein Q4C09_04340, partial [Atopobiaceae bacterium]|nr:hypothetical protein [Atopobiaceae bacterium]
MPDSLNNGNGQTNEQSVADERFQDEFEALSSFDEEAIADVVYTGWDNVYDEQPVETVTFDDEGTVYGLGVDKFDDETNDSERRDSSPIPKPVIIGALALALIGGTGFAMWRLQDRMASNRKVEVVKPVAEKPKEKKKEKTYSAADIRSMISKSISYAGQGLTVEASRINVEVHDGHVLVTHQLTENDQPQADHLVRRAGLRANVLACMLMDKLVANEGTDGKTFVDLTWVVRDPQGNAYLAVVEGPGDIRTSDSPYGVFAGSRGYVLSPSILHDLGDDSGLSESAGETPCDLAGNPIEANAEIKDEEPAEENATTQTTANTNANSSSSSGRGQSTYYDGGDDYYYDDSDNGGYSGGGGGGSSDSGGSSSSGGGSSPGGGESGGGSSDGGSSPGGGEPGGGSS